MHVFFHSFNDYYIYLFEHFNEFCSTASCCHNNEILFQTAAVKLRRAVSKWFVGHHLYCQLLHCFAQIIAICTLFVTIQFTLAQIISVFAQSLLHQLLLICTDCGLCTFIFLFLLHFYIFLLICTDCLFALGFQPFFRISAIFPASDQQVIYSFAFFCTFCININLECILYLHTVIYLFIIDDLPVIPLPFTVLLHHSFTVVLHWS